jgi:hypothetical protein
VDFLLLAIVVGLGALLGFGLGMLLSRKLFRWGERGDEEPGDRDD